MSASTTSRPRPWGVLASIAWVLVLKLVAYIIDILTKPALEQSSEFLWDVIVLGVFSIQLLVIVVIVRLARWPVAEYLGWTRPHPKDVAFGFVVALAFYLLGQGARYFAGVLDPFGIVTYLGARATGVSPWWFVLQWWPSIVCAPILEESVYRGFLWRGIEYGIGRVTALLVTSLIFAAAQYEFMLYRNELGPIIDAFLLALILGWMRLRSGNTTVPIICHFLYNLLLRSTPIFASGLL
jgi:membrane protease YdiL (CAAX protease family)